MVVVAGNARYLAGISDIVDPILSMEPYYIDMAGRPTAAIVAQDPAWGWLYALWFKPFRALIADPLEVHGLNVRVLSIAVTVALYFYTLLLTRRAALATTSALFFLVSDFNVPLSSKVCSFALLVVLLGLALSELATRRSERAAVAAVGVLVASYARPELYAAGVTLWFWALWSMRRDLPRASWRPPIWALAGTAIILAVAARIGTPVWSVQHDNQRLFTAFREHFAWNWGRWHGGWEYYLTVWQREFGAAVSIPQALAANPAAFLHHLADNTLGAIRLLATTTLDHYPILLPASWGAARVLENTVVATAAASLVIWSAASPVRRRASVACAGRILPVLAAISVFSLGSAVFVFPERHYLVVPVALVLPLLAAIASANLPSRRIVDRRIAAVAALAAVAAVPSPFLLPETFGDPGGAGEGRIAVVRPVTDTVRAIRALGLEPPVHVLTFTDGIGELLGEGFTEVKIWRSAGRSLRDYIADERVDVIVTMERGRKSFLVDDPYWMQIQTDPQSTGFLSVPTSDDNPARIWVRSDRTLGSR